MLSFEFLLYPLTVRHFETGLFKKVRENPVVPGPARYEIRQYFQWSRMPAAIDQQEDTKSWGIL